MYEELAKAITGPSKVAECPLIKEGYVDNCLSCCVPAMCVFDRIDSIDSRAVEREWRRAKVMILIRGHTVKDIAKRLGVSEKTIYQDLKRKLP